jgi:hypothetical protein
LRLKHKSQSAPHARQTPATPHVIVAPPKPGIDFRDPTRLPFVAPMSQRGTVIMPVVQTEDAVTTQILPAIAADVPPSAQHTDPARWYERLVVEDESADSPVRPGRGRHVLAELKASDDGMPDLVGHDEPAPVVQGNYSRVVAALAPPETLAGAVRIARRAHSMFVARRHRLDEDESRLDACWRRIAEFNADWDRQLRDAEIARHGQRAVVAAEELAATYENNRLRVEQENARRAADGEAPLDATATTFTRDMVAKIQQMLVDEAKAGSAGVR